MTTLLFTFKGVVDGALAEPERASCETCRFFAPPRADEQVTDRASEAWDMVPDAHGRCHRIIHGNGGDTAYEQSAATYNAEPALVTDGSGYAASLRVLPSFGCILHEVKP